MSYGDDFRCSNLEEGVPQHMVRNDDRSYKDFFDLAGAINLSERRFRSILEQAVHPEVRTGNDQKRIVDAINPYLHRDGFELLPVDHISGYPLYRIVKKGGVSGHCKNETGKNRGLHRLRIACLFHSRIPTRERRAPVLIQNFCPHLK
jgi:hypothetical protein